MVDREKQINKAGGGAREVVNIFLCPLMKVNDLIISSLSLSPSCDDDDDDDGGWWVKMKWIIIHSFSAFLKSKEEERE